MHEHSPGTATHINNTREGSQTPNDNNTCTHSLTRARHSKGVRWAAALLQAQARWPHHIYKVAQEKPYMQYTVWRIETKLSPRHKHGNTHSRCLSAECSLHPLGVLSVVTHAQPHLVQTYQNSCTPAYVLQALTIDTHCNTNSAEMLTFATHCNTNSAEVLLSWLLPPQPAGPCCCASCC